MFKKNALCHAVTAALATLAVGPVLAQDLVEEEVLVTGLRASLEASMDIKRASSGVVDAISAEDIGKFPDTNLAESLQRITGVSIDRINGEGSQITVRGFGPANNMVTLNGRVMPSGFTYGGGSGAGGTFGGATRAFDFANLASESVSGVQVYKTGRADVASGGIGATVNISTARPLENEGLNFTVAGKAVNDTTTRIGDNVTPELSGLFSWSDGTFGVALSGSYQVRHSGAAGGAANNWNIAAWDAEDPTNNLYSFTDDAVIVNTPDDGQLFARPNDFRWSFSDKERERTNVLATFQWAPTDSIEATLDYVYARNELWEHRGEWTMWMNNGNSIDAVTFDDSPVATPIYIHEVHATKDVGYEQQLREQTNTLDSVAFNVAWEVNDSLTLKFDAHDSSMENMPSGLGDSGEIAISIGTPVSTSFSYDFSGDMPVGSFTWRDDVPRLDQEGNQVVIDGVPQYYGNNNGVFDAGDAGSAQGRVFYAAQTMDISEFKIDGSWDLGNGRLDFGIDHTKTDMLQQASTRQVNLGGWGVATTPEFADGTLYTFNFADQFDDYNMDGSFDSGIRAYDVKQLCRETEALYGESQDWACEIERNFTQDNRVEETINGFYFQFALEGDLADHPYHVLAGVRYEQTDLTSTAKLRRPLYRVWQSNNDFQVTEYADGDKVPIAVDNDYSNMLPSFDFDIELLDNLVGRFSFSNTIARANYGNLYAGASNFQQTDPTGFRGAQPTATRTSPELLPLDSKNTDLSLEWYYQEGSYASVGFFEKRVNNFIGTGQAVETHYGMLDASTGPRMDQAKEDLAGMGINDPNADQLFAMAVCLTYAPPTYTQDEYNGYDLVSLAAECSDPANFDNSTDQGQTWLFGLEQPFDIHAIQQGEAANFGADYEAQWLTSFPVNNKEAKIYGSEWALQHFFGESGFGIQANYTMVNGDVGFNDLASPTEEQFALLGLSDTINVVGIYENYGFQVRLAYNWRDSFLRQTNQGSSRNPVYVDEYSQWDLNASYDVNDHFNVFFEGLNLTGENIRWYQRSKRMTRYVEELGPRYQLGMRYTF